MRWRNLDDTQKVYTDRTGNIVGRVIEKADGHGAYHIIPNAGRNRNDRRLLGFFADSKQAQKAVENAVDAAA